MFFGHQTYTEVGNLGGTGSENNYYYTFYRQGNHLSRVGQAGIPDKAPATGIQTQGNFLQAGYYVPSLQTTDTRQRTRQDIALDNSRNPTGYSQTEAERLGGMHWILQKSQEFLPTWMEPESATIEIGAGIGLGTKGAADINLDLLKTGMTWAQDEQGKATYTEYGKVGATLGGSGGPFSGEIGASIYGRFVEKSQDTVQIRDLLGLDLAGSVKAGIPYVVGIAGLEPGFEFEFMGGWEAVMSKETYENLNPIQEAVAAIPLLGPVMLALDPEIKLEWAGSAQFATTEAFSADVGGYALVGGSVSGSFEKEQVWWQWPSSK